MVEQDMDQVLLGAGCRPAVATYWERLQARASYGAAIDGYRHPTVARGTARLRAAKAADPRLRRLLEDAAPEVLSHQRAEWPGPGRSAPSIPRCRHPAECRRYGVPRWPDSRT
jgi:hypothetical protein